MREDEVYRFIVIRDPATRLGDKGEREGHDARLVSAYADGDDSKSPVGRTVGTLLESGDVESARAAASAFLDAMSDAERAKWRTDLRAGASLALALKRDALADDHERALKNVRDRGLPWSGDSNGHNPDALTAWRNDAADLLVAATVSGDPSIDRTDACASICAAEAATRIQETADAGPTRLPWQPAVVEGRVVLPFGVGILAGSSQATSLRQRFALAVISPQLGPADLLAAQAVRSYIGDLIVMQQQLRRYELGEIAYIENVLLSENYERVHRDLKRVELTVTDQQETETINERDLQSTDRDELRSELAKLTHEDIRFGVDISATVSGKTPYGDYSVGGGASVAYDRSNEQREQSAHDHVTEVVSKAREQITERTRSTRSTTTTTEDEDVTTHGFDNRGGHDHVVGVYRWVEKHYDLHLINYGRRLFYEIVIPEPAAYWRALSARRTLVAAGPVPTWPALPGVGQGADPEPLAASHLGLESGNAPADFPARWTEIVELAGQWGVELGPPPAATTEIEFEISVTPDTTDKSNEPPHMFSRGNDFYYESPSIHTATLEQAPKVPDGYEATSGMVAFTGWNTVRSGGSQGFNPGSAVSHWSVYEQGHAWLQLGGRQEHFSIAAQPGDGPVTRSMDAIFPAGASTLTGELGVALTTSLNGALCSCKLSCRRTASAETLWIAKTLDAFATAYAARVADHSNAANQSALDQRDRDYQRTDATYRAIERRELKRQIVDLLLRDSLEGLGDLVVTPTGSSNGGPVTQGSIDTTRLAAFTRVVNFFEQAFDWANLIYIFAPYFYGRGDDWEAGALAEEADPQFTAFLSAGAARIQLPVQLGYEPYVQAFFAGLGALDPAQSVPWLNTGRPIALDLAAAAREGFELATGRLSADADSSTVTVSGATYSAADDTGRELRINGHIFKILEVRGPGELVLDRNVSDQAVDRVEYERGGLTVGPVIALSLPSTLVAIDKPGLTLPQFPSRYN